MRTIATLMCMGMPALAVFSQAAIAQSYPSKPVKVLVGFAAGGGTDALARLLGSHLGAAWGQPFVVENRAGAEGSIASDLTAKAPADGHTINFITNSFTIAPAQYKVPYDPIKNFSPITQLATNPNLLVVTGSLPVKTVKELVTLARSQPGQLSSGTSGLGGPYLALQLFKSMAGIEIVNVTYKGSAQAVVDLIAGRTQVMFGSISTTLPHVQTGKVKALAVTSRKRSPSIPDLPTIEEAGGLSGYEYSTWYGVLAPANTPAEIVQKLRSGIVTVLDAAEIRNLLAKSGFDRIGSTPAEFADIIRSDLAKWKRVVSESPKP